MFDHLFLVMVTVMAFVLTAQADPHGGPFYHRFSRGHQSGHLGAHGKNRCYPNPCENGGTCVNWYGNFFCKCAPGYTGIVCHTEIDECESDPCQNGGTCNEGVNGYECDCPPFISGINCETDPCACPNCDVGECVPQSTTTMLCVDVATKTCLGSDGGAVVPTVICSDSSQCTSDICDQNVCCNGFPSKKRRKRSPKGR